MKRGKFWLMAVVCGGVLAGGAAMLTSQQQACAQPARGMSYAEDITPIFHGYCISCHQPGGQGYQASGLDLTSYDSLMRGTRFGPMVIPGQPNVSNLFVLIEGRAALRMPYGHRPLPSCLRQEIWSWIFEGAKNN